MKDWHKSRSFPESFQHAWRGLLLAFSLEKNLKRQLVAGMVALLLAIGLQVSVTHFLILITISALVLALELANSALEQIADVFHPEYHSSIRRAKDIMAGAVFIASLAALAIGVFIFLPPLTNLVS